MTRRVRTALVLAMTRWLGLFLSTTLRSMVFANDTAGPHSAPSKSSSPIVSTIQKIIIDPMEKWKEQSLTVLEDRPFVTLSFAQSLDAQIALYLDKNNQDETIDDGNNNNNHNHPQDTSSNYPLSGPESMLVTHALRSIHDGILVGGRTLATDNPRLTNRLWNVPTDASQPRPIVLDTHLRHIRQCWENGTVLKAKNLIVCCSHEAAKLWHSKSDMFLQLDQEKKKMNITILPCDTCPNGKLELKRLLFQLKTKFGIHSLMVEGGSNILSSFVQQEELVDCICITVAPKILGSQGLAAFTINHHTKNGSSGHNDKIGLLEFRDTQWIPMGNDCILLGRRTNQWKP